jgi:glyceraldehyde-3-phosphate dehydrogenase type I
MKRVAINGLGRIGRMVLHHFMDAAFKDVEIAAVNDLVPPEHLAYLIKYDSVHGRAPFAVQAEGDVIHLGGLDLKVYAEKDPAQLPWKDLGVDAVIECTGFFTKRALAAKHLEAGARRVIISAPSHDADFTVIIGVNDQEFDPGQHQVISNASCTTNSLVPPLKVLLDNFGIERAMVTTVHAYTGTQGLVDKPAKKPIRGRAAAVSLIPRRQGLTLPQP